MNSLRSQRAKILFNFRKEWAYMIVAIEDMIVPEDH